jgi:hypothetical protein
MSEDLEDLLREHYRRAAEGIAPDTELVERGRSAVRPARARTWPRVLAAAAAIAVIAAVTWGLLRPVHRDESPATPPAPVSQVPSPTPPPSPPSRPKPRPTGPATPRPTVSRPIPSKAHATPPARRPPRSSTMRVPTPTPIRSFP